MDIIILILNVICLVLLAVTAFRVFTAGSGSSEETVRKLEKAIAAENRALRQELNGNISAGFASLGGLLNDSQLKASAVQKQSFDGMSDNVAKRLDALEARFASLEKSNAESLEGVRALTDRKLTEMRETVEKRLEQIRTDNDRKLDSIRNTVSEKLDQRINDSFKQVSERLEQVYKGLGEMQSIAVGVGDLKKVLSNVKTRGILGEIQLGAILAEILSPEQYDTEAAVDPAGKNRVEFAVKLPGDGTETVYLPIDSKFPGDRFAALQDAYGSGSREAVEAARRVLFDEVRKCAKDINEKYIVPPYTTAFAIMFLPFEGLYAEVVNGGLVEELQRKFSVNIAGPSTMAAMLNSLQMGFRTLAIQKRSGEVWQVLGAVKTEFGNFENVLKTAQNQIRTAENSIDKLIGVRTRAITRKLRDVEALPTEDAAKLITAAADDADD